MSVTVKRLQMALYGVVMLSGGVAVAQNVDILVRTLDGKNGKPFANQRLLVFTGRSADAVKRRESHTSVTTSKDGVATIAISASETQWIQIWADGLVLCQSNPNQNSFSVATIMSNGLTTPNTCGSLVREAAPGHFIAFARPASWSEKMRQ